MQTENQDLNVFQKLSRFFTSRSHTTQCADLSTHPARAKSTSCKDLLRSSEAYLANLAPSMASESLSDAEILLAEKFVMGRIDPILVISFLRSMSSVTEQVKLDYFLTPLLICEIKRLRGLTDDGFQAPSAKEER